MDSPSVRKHDYLWRAVEAEAGSRSAVARRLGLSREHISGLLLNKYRRLGRKSCGALASTYGFKVEAVLQNEGHAA